MAKVITDSNFKSDVLDASQLVVVDFWAKWCGPCLALAPTIEELATEYEGKAVIGKLDVDDNSDSSFTYGVRSIPTLLFFKGGKLVDKHVGLIAKGALKQKIEGLL